MSEPKTSNAATNDEGEDVESKGGLVIIVQPDGTEVQGSLPPIGDIVIPSTATKSACIRWLFAVGYPIKEIYQFLGIRYQMVRNIVTTVPKRAAREDLPPLKIRYRENTRDLIDEAMDGALEASMMVSRKERLKNKHTTVQPQAEEPEEE